MTEDSLEHFMDGNAAGSLLQEIFVLDATTAQIQCASCGFTEPVGSLRLYAATMGAILRCIHCDCIHLRATHTPHGRWLEMPHARYLRF